MLSQMKWVRFATTVLVALALLYASALAKKPPKDPPPDPDPPPVTYELTWLDAFPESTVSAVNSHGHVVGTVGNGSGFVYLEGLGTLVNLDEAVTGGLDDLAAWFDPDTNIQPQRINDAGQIVGHGFLLTPVPDEN